MTTAAYSLDAAIANVRQASTANQGGDHVRTQAHLDMAALHLERLRLAHTELARVEIKEPTQ